MENDNRVELPLHARMIERYSSLLQKVKNDTFSLSELVATEEKIARTSLPEPEKQVHQAFVKELACVYEKVEHLKWLSEHLKILHDFQQTLTQVFDKEKIYHKAFELVSRVMDTDAFFIAFYREGEENIHIPFAIDNGVRYDNLTVPFGEGITSEVLRTGRSIHIHTGKELEQRQFSRWGNPKYSTNTVIFVPMILRNEVKGVITAQSYREFAYKKEHEELLRIIGAQVAGAVENAELYDRIFELSIRDELTGLKNRRAFSLDLHKKLHEVDSKHQPLTLFMIDSDNLKEVNDTYGHHAGDLLLRYVADCIRQCLGKEEEAYRYAGDEFIVLAPNLAGEAAQHKAKKLQRYLRLYPLMLNGRPFFSSLSIGIATYPSSAKNAEELKRHADEALYFSKKQGRNMVTLYEEMIV
jgi:diguanylate cyclase (GGDEF)-like protein